MAQHIQASLVNHSLTPAGYARQLLATLAADTSILNSAQLSVADDDRSAALLWAQSGAMWLSGHADGEPRWCDAPLAACAQGAWLALAAMSEQPLLNVNEFAAYKLLGERAAIAGLQRNGRISAGGACRLYQAMDGFIALNLARVDDSELLPAWLECEVTVAQLPQLIAARRVDELLERAQWLGLAAAIMAAPVKVTEWFRQTRYAEASTATHTRPLVVDMTGLWAGPLCGHLLQQCGARVIKLESITRPDGARAGPVDFYDLLNAGKESVALDLRSAQGRGQLQQLLSCADIVLESSRPRALEQMGIFAEDTIAKKTGQVWLSITGYGRTAPMREWIAYGDDAGVAAGLSWLMGGAEGDPVFCGDAIADPLTGLHAAVLALSSWRAGGGVLLDVALVDVLRYCISANSSSITTNKSAIANKSQPVSMLEVALPQARRPMAKAAMLGADTQRILSEFGIS